MMLLTHSTGAQVRTQFEIEKIASWRLNWLISCLLSSGNYLAFRMRFFIYLFTRHSFHRISRLEPVQ